MNSISFLANKSDSFKTSWVMIAAFLCYTGMYAVRKSFLAGNYLDLGLGYDLDTKTLLVISQVLGYMCSKFLGIKIISEMSHKNRAFWLISLVSFGLLMLFAFAYVPTRFKILALFLNGLPLGMVFGVVFSFLEGRKQTELLAAGLSATFIFSTGFVKTVGVLLMQNYSISETLMPFATGLIFFPIFLVSVFMLQHSTAPTKADITERSERLPMSKKDKIYFLSHHGLGFTGLVIIYILLTVIRDFRDNFIVEFWSELGYSQKPELITLTEIPVAVIVLIIAALGVMIRNNFNAFNLGMWLTLGSSFLVLSSTILFNLKITSPVFWMICTGIGVYLPYILFHCLLFERLIALLKLKGNVGFLFYTADALGYLGSVLILIGKESINYKGSWKDFFVSLNISSSIIIAVIVLITVLYFKNKLIKKSM